jgi:hypothetical protein
MLIASNRPSPDVAKEKQTWAATANNDFSGGSRQLAAPERI